MLECETTNPEPAHTVQKAAARFDARRVYTVLIVAPLLYVAICYLPPMVFTAIAAVAGALCLSELYRLCLQPSAQPLTMGIGIVGCIALIIGPHFPNMVQPTLLTALVATLSIPLLVKMPLQQSLKEGAITMTGLLYIGLTLSYLVMIRLLPQGEWFLLFLLLVTWAADTGAYYVGRRFGKHKLAPIVSPGKTWEGAAASGATGTLLGAIYLPLVIPGLGIPLACLIALVANAAGQVGDLAESALKRGAGVKDSGTILPGHGGVLDRLDSTMFTIPVLYVLVSLLNR